MRFNNIFEEEYYFPCEGLTLDEGREFRYLMNNTFDFLHALIHDSHSIDMYFKNKEYEKAENDFYVMKQEIIEKFNAIYTGNTALSTAICNINLGNTTIQHFVKCNTEEFNDSDLTIFFINTLSNLIEDNEPIIYVLMLAYK